jgi:hypothetical protein
MFFTLEDSENMSEVGTILAESAFGSWAPVLPIYKKFKNIFLGLKKNLK